MEYSQITTYFSKFYSNNYVYSRYFNINIKYGNEDDEWIRFESPKNMTTYYDRKCFTYLDITLLKIKPNPKYAQLPTKYTARVNWMDLVPITS